MRAKLPKLVVLSYRNSLKLKKLRFCLSSFFYLLYRDLLILLHWSDYFALFDQIFKIFHLLLLESALKQLPRSLFIPSIILIPLILAFTFNIEPFVDETENKLLDIIFCRFLKIIWNLFIDYGVTLRLELLDT